MDKVIEHLRLKRSNEALENLKHWLSRPASERLSAVEVLRRQVYENSPGLQRTARVFQRSQG
jgi:hypothetical protein